MVLDILRWIASTELSIFVRESSWAFPVIECVHVIGLTLVVGTVAVVDLRLLGLASTGRRYSALAQAVLPWTWGAFAVAAAAGALMLISKPLAYVENPDLRVKLALILAAACNMAVFQLFVRGTVADWDGDATPPLPARIAGAVSLLCWIAVVVFGRRIGFSMALP